MVTEKVLYHSKSRTILPVLTVMVVSDCRQTCAGCIRGWQCVLLLLEEWEV